MPPTTSCSITSKGGGFAFFHQGRQPKGKRRSTKSCSHLMSVIFVELEPPLLPHVTAPHLPTTFTHFNLSRFHLLYPPSSFCDFYTFLILLLAWPFLQSGSQLAPFGFLSNSWRYGDLACCTSYTTSLFANSYTTMLLFFYLLLSLLLHFASL
ncbi:hypothetical protein B0T20DRAFT_160813 [Sordaria brevicollis]|uniref:Uncharacterized protein n=1 Tax=Sordaria brevicollis TaxID=83679 RepID=A0AAE0PJM3_SORBR|nr:hypothetical protein B0T20DRAFT_160813 [Sordaria brevicollis]